MERKQVDLDTFLAEMPAEAAAKARAAAARIDELEHAAQRIGQSDTTYLRLFVLSGLLFAAAVWLLLSDKGTIINGMPLLTDALILLMAGALPALILIYSIKMNERTRLDRQKFDILENYFLPHNAIYLPPGRGRKTGMVTIAESNRGWSRKPEHEKYVKKPGWYW